MWREMPDRYPFVQLDEFVVISNHVHGIVRIKYRESYIDAGCCKDAINRVSTFEYHAATLTNNIAEFDIN